MELVSEAQFDFGASWRGIPSYAGPERLFPGPPVSLTRIQCRGRVALKVEEWPAGRLIAYARNPRKNDHVVDQMVAAIKEFGFRIPVVARSDGMVVDGHLRLKAARRLGLETVPVVLADDLSEEQIKAFRLLANRSATWAEWDNDLLRLELSELNVAGFGLEGTGFELEEIRDVIFPLPKDRKPRGGGDEDESQQVFDVLVKCGTEDRQIELLERLTEEGYECKALIS